jgi:hypothetical protein
VTVASSAISGTITDPRKKNWVDINEAKWKNNNVWK